MAIKWSTPPMEKCKVCGKNEIPWPWYTCLECIDRWKAKYDEDKKQTDDKA